MSLKIPNRLSRIVCNSPRWNLLGQVGGTPRVGTAEGILDFNAALTGDDLKELVDNQLFSYLTGKNPVHLFVNGK